MSTTPTPLVPGVPTEDDPTPVILTDEEGGPAVLPETGAGEQSKVRVILGLLKKLIGVSDVANLRLSLPASLLEPIPNLEYWQYGDRADFFAAMGESEDPFERMLSVLRFTFSKELKFVRARLGKPYNSALGEHFRCHWYIQPASIDPITKEPIVYTHLHDPDSKDGPMDPTLMSADSSVQHTPVTSATDISDTISVRSLQGALPSPALPSPAKTPTSIKPKLKGSWSTKSLKTSPEQKTVNGGTQTPANGNGKEPVPVIFLCEQVSHHPPISAAYYTCPDRGVEAVGMDQIAAKVSGMTIQIAPGESNKGIFVTLSSPSPGAGEEYQITHPLAQVNGLLKGTYYGTVSDKVYVTCRGGKDKQHYRTIVEYKDESWIGRPKFLLEGVIYLYTPGEESENWSRIKQVPLDKVVANIEGVWRKQIKWRRKGEKEWRILIDLDALDLVPKQVRPIDDQHEKESRKMWDPVTKNMLAKNWNEATKQKQIIEQKQRDRAAELKKSGKQHDIVYFNSTWEDGRPTLSEDGRNAIQAEYERSKQEIRAATAAASTSQ